jgi:membrane-bound serine protease (ClpP class)
MMVGSTWGQSATQPSMQSATIQPATQPLVTGGKAAIIQLSGEINDYNKDRLFRQFQQARDMGAKTVILDLDTYGGLVTSGLEISRFLKRQDDLHTIAFVEDKAISAGAMIAMACDEIVMSSSATLGDCAPIVFNFDGTLDSLPAAERAKQESPILSDFLESAHRNHHDPLLAEAMVAVEVSVYWVQSPTGEKKFVNKDDHAKLLATGWKDVTGAPVPVDSDQTLLTVDSEQALAYGLATGKSEDAQTLAEQRDMTVVGDFHTTVGDDIVEDLGSWPVRLLLLIIFMSAANVVIHAPGHGVAEVVGLIALLLMLGVPLMTGYAQWWEILTIFLGLSLIAVEIILPGHMVPGFVGGCLVLVGLVMTFVPMEPRGAPGFLPNMSSTWVALERGLAVVAAGMGCSLFLWFWMNRYLPKVPYFKRIILNNVSGGGTDPAPQPTSFAGVWPPVGAVGKAVSELKPVARPNSSIRR